jgi:hypothetical protein
MSTKCDFGVKLKSAYAGKLEVKKSNCENQNCHIMFDIFMEKIYDKRLKSIKIFCEHIVQWLVLRNTDCETCGIDSHHV